MEKYLAWGSLGTSLFLTAVFLLDMVMGYPFGGISFMLDMFGLVAGGLIAFMSYETVREIK